MSEQENTQQASSSFGGLIMVVFGWGLFGMMIVANSAIAGGGAGAQSPFADVFNYAPYIIGAVLLLVSLVSLRTSTYLWVAAGGAGALNMICSVVSAASAVGVVALGLLRMYGKI